MPTCVRCKLPCHCWQNPQHPCFHRPAEAAYEDLVLERDALLAAGEVILAELEERNAQEGMALTISEKAEWLTPGFQMLVAAVKKSKTV